MALRRMTASMTASTEVGQSKGEPEQLQETHIYLEIEILDRVCEHQKLFRLCLC